MVNYKIELLKKEKLQETIDVCIKCFGEDWRNIAEKSFPECVGNSKYKPYTLLALDDNKVIGMSMISIVPVTPDAYCITWLCVDPKYRNKGIASALLQKSEDYILSDLMKFDKAMVMLASGIKAKYYEELGYEEKFITHRDDPFMIKFLKRKT